ncbi:MAG: efflux RND transporter permease subunit [Bacteroidota bacterium]
MNLAKFSIDNDRITWMILITVILLGISAYFSLPRDSMPPFAIRTATVVTVFPGASPERVELLVTDKIEKKAQELPELKEVTSTSRTGLSVVQVELKDEVKEEDMQDVWDRLRRKLNVIDDLPENVYPNLDDDGIGDVYGIIVGLTSDGFSYAEMKNYADEIKDDYIKLKDAAKVEIGGIQDQRVFVEFDNSRLKEYDLSASRLQQIISSTNILSTGGKINIGNERIILEPSGNFDNVDEIKNMLVPVGNGAELVRLMDITNIRRGYVDPQTQIVKVNGKQALTLHINLKDDSNILDLGIEVDRVTREWTNRLPIGMELTRVSSLDAYIDYKISNFVGNLVQSISIVLLVMLVFLGFRTGIIIASLIPIVTITTIMIMGQMTIGLNQVTLAALIMALGMMVDNGIVVAETIMVKLDQGLAKKRSAVEAFTELWKPLLISTLTTSAAFLAFYLSPNVMGDIVGPIFVVITIALGSSCLISLTIIIMFCYIFLKEKKEGEESKPSFIDRLIGTLKNYYKQLIVWALSYKYMVSLALLVALFIAFYGFTTIPFLFFPDSDRNLITLDVNLTEGSKIEATEQVIIGLEAFITDSLLLAENVENPEEVMGVLSWSSYTGEGPESYDLGYDPDEANSNYAHMLIKTSAHQFNNPVINKIDRYAFNNFPNADIKVYALAAGESGPPIEVKVSGRDPDELSKIANRVKLKLADIPGTKNVKDDWGPKSKKFIVQIDQSRAQKAGVTSLDIANSLETVLDGFNTGSFREEDESIPIVMRNNADQQQTFTSLETLNVYSQSTGQNIPLLQVASIGTTWQYSKMQRLDRIRSVNIECELKDGANAAEITTVLEAFMLEESENWPDRYVYEFGGDASRTEEGMGSVIGYLPVSAFIIVLLLIIQFNSVRKMTMVVLTIPLAIIGVVIGLLLFNEEFGFMPFMGVISLAGIIINNAIVLVDRMEIEQNDYGRTEKDAVVTACIQRFRPILLATFTTVFGMIPLYLSGGAMWEGMAVVIMVGLLFGTIVTLVFIPSFYSIVYRIDYKDYVLDERLFDQ